MVRPLEIGPLVIDPPILQAPMAGFTNYAFRQVVRRHGGVGLPATEMFSARGFLRDRFPPRPAARTALGRLAGISPAGNADLGQ